MLYFFVVVLTLNSKGQSFNLVFIDIYTLPCFKIGPGQ